MAAVTVSQMRGMEAAALRHGWTEETLMDAAARRLAGAIAAFFQTPGTVVAYLGKGHNAGDACVALRHLRDVWGWHVAIRAGHPAEQWAELARVKFIRLGIPVMETAPDWRDMNRPLVLLDALVGIGGKGALRSPLLELAAEMAYLRQTTGARVAALDVPSGMDPDSGTVFEGAVVADITFQIGAEKSGLMHSQAVNHCGALAIVPVAPLTDASPHNDRLIAPQSMAFGKARRPFDCHKGMAGRVSVVAGSADYSGAAVLCAAGALRAGAGMVTLHVPSAISPLISAKCPPEVIVRSIDKPADVIHTRCDARVIGCGLGGTWGDDLLPLLLADDVPTVLDADALNLLARHQLVPELGLGHILTPHPGEFARLAPDLAETGREESARAFCERFPGTLILKGARSIIASRGQPLWFNSTGGPAMATAGQGDVLAGVIGALLARGDAPMHAAALGAWICGRAAERAMCRESEESLTAGSLLPWMGAAFEDWRGSLR